MVNESSQPKPGDAVLGGNNPPPIGAAVLGGIEGVKQRCASPDFKARIAGLREAVKHGEAGIELLLHGLKDKVLEVGLLSYLLLQENVDPELKRLLEIYAPLAQKYLFNPCWDKFTSIAFSPNGQLLVSSSVDQTIKLWDVERCTLINTLTGHSSDVYSAAFSPNGQLLVSGSWDQTIKLWDVETGKLKTTLSEDSSNVYSVAFSPNGQLLASGTADKTIKLWNVKTGTLKTTLSGHSSNVYSVAFSPNGELLASGSADKTIKLWDVETGTLKITLSGHYKVYSVTFSPNGELLASGSADKTIKLWDVETGTLKTTLSGHSSDVYSVAFSPNGQILAIASRDGSIKLWDVETGTLKTTIFGYSSNFFSVDFSPNGELRGNGIADKTIKLWEAEISNLNIVDPVALFHSYLEIKQPQNSSLYEAIQILDRGTAAEKEVAFLQLKAREEPVVKAVFLSYVNAATPLYETLKFLKYFLDMNLWQEAKQVSEKILWIGYGHKEVMNIFVYYYSENHTFKSLHSLWQEYAVLSLIKGQEPLDFFAALDSQIKAAAEVEDNRSDTFSRRCYHETHE